MRKRRGRKAHSTTALPVQTTTPRQHAETYTFGDSTPVMDKRDILDYAECIGNGRCLEPPVSFSGLAKSLRATVHHSSPIYVKRNILGRPLRLETTPPKFTCRGVKDGVYWFVNDWKEPHEFSAGSVFHLLEPDINQEL